MSFLQKVSTSVVIALFSVVMILDLFVQPEYSYEDAPVFVHRSFSLVLALICIVAFYYMYLNIGKRLSWNPVLPLVLFVVLSLLFLLAVPMIPVSDQLIVYTIASDNLKDPKAYMAVNVNVIPTILYVWGLVSVFGKSIWIPKCANVFWGLMSLLLISKIYGFFSDKEARLSSETTFFSEAERKMLWFGATFFPSILYSNHIYNDVPAVTFSLLMIYLVIRKDQSALMRIITIIVSCLQFVLRQSGIILVVAAAIYIFFYQRKRMYALIYFLCVVLLYILIEKSYTMVIVGSEAHGYPVWSFIKMGVNEAEFGFQDNTHSSDVTLWDCIARYREYGLVKVIRIFAKKTFWIWGEGTYQAGRYGYGYLNNEYSYETFITKLLSGSSDRKLRVITNTIIRAQYLMIMLLSVVGSIRVRKKNEFSLYFFIICGFFLFYLIWEIKSRYLYSIYPILLLLAMYGIETLRIIKKGYKNADS